MDNLTKEKIEEARQHFSYVFSMFERLRSRGANITDLFDILNNLSAIDEELKKTLASVDKVNEILGIEDKSNYA